MLKTLLKKQLLELSAFYFQDKKTGRNRSRAGTVGYALLFAFLFLSVASVFMTVSGILASALVAPGNTSPENDWLYFAIMGLMTILLSTFASAFTTYAGLYQARDNELLLSMPIPPGKILLVRMTGVFLMSLLYSGLAWVPSVVQYRLHALPSAASIVYSVLLTPVIAMFVLVLSCALGWVVALISSKLKNRAFVSVALSVLFLVGYYAVFLRLNTLLQALAANSARLGSVIRNWIYPLYQLGLAAAGDAVGMVQFVCITGALFALCWFVLSRSFVRITIADRGAKKAAYRESMVRTTGAEAALLRREFRHFLSSPSYMLNCGLGVLILPAAAVVAWIKADVLRDLLSMLTQTEPTLAKLIPAVLTATVCMGVSMDAVTAPSVSLEGRSMWILRSLPVETAAVFRAKERIHILLNVPPAVLTAGVFGCVMELDAVTILCMIVLCAIFVVFSADLGLIVGVLKPNLSWSSEIVPIKQSFSVFVALFGGWIVSALLVLGYWPLSGRIGAGAYLGACIVVFAVLILLMKNWLRGKGAKRFESLQ